MGFLQAVLGGLFTILGAASMFFIAYKAMTIGNDVAEMKELLREMQRGLRGTTTAASNFPDPLNNLEPAPPVRAEKEFVMPPPISRRLDAERGVHGRL